MEIAIVCSECNDDLNASVWKQQINVDPCDKCSKEAFQEGRREGYEEGAEENG